MNFNLINLKNYQTFKFWWAQFPIQLKIITKIRFFASFGAGGVIYLTSLIFNNIGLSATEIGFGFTLSAIVGTLTRFYTGNYLNNNKEHINIPLTISSSFSIISSFLLIYSKNTLFYLIGQTFVGAAAGIYWPTVELSVPYLCEPIDSRKAYALVRSSEALGIFLGVLTGSFLNSFLYFKSVYIIDIICMSFIILILIKNKSLITKKLEKNKSSNLNFLNNYTDKWNKNTKLIIFSIFLITTCLALIQVTLPLDFVKGGLIREPISKSITSYIISFQLILLFLLQWPIGKWLSSKERLYGLKFSLISFTIGTVLLFLSSYYKYFGIIILVIAMIFCNIGTSAFLPTSTDLVFKIAPINKKGFALAILSQCFALGYFLGPLISGSILDIYGYASVIWLGISILCLIMTFFIFNKKFSE